VYFPKTVDGFNLFRRVKKDIFLFTDKDKISFFTKQFFIAFLGQAILVEYSWYGGLEGWYGAKEGWYGAKEGWYGGLEGWYGGKEGCMF